MPTGPAGAPRAEGNPGGPPERLFLGSPGGAPRASGERFWTLRGSFWSKFGELFQAFPGAFSRSFFVHVRCCCPSVCGVANARNASSCPAQAAQRPSPPPRRNTGSNRTKCSQLQAPGAGRAAAEQGHQAIHSACNLDACVALATLALLLLVSLCSRFSCRSRFSPRVSCRLQFWRLSR